MLQQVDFSLHDLKGLKKHQIFRLDYEGFKEPRGVVSIKSRDEIPLYFELFSAIEHNFFRKNKSIMD